ncbi:peptidase M75 [Phaeobacter gallaeciensis]|uniref:Peptidase M75 n=2 Tax=Roseobacteraceae TaxID=2854170 RepID=A0A366WYB0_9RHOB|nr:MULTISPECIES: imelysin family protein [Roseobacteraceae]MBT3141240.1 imelysin family protein [Falsiruegeria litorea]MBT8170761.1 imelysin family protein [Falsiruegeria litorea]RBW54447.1 peptidase M75 [Phaeobacter gallaeciensis]
MLRISALVLALTTSVAHADLADTILDDIVLPGFDQLAISGQALDAAAQTDCRAESEPLRAAFGETLDAWTAVSHFRFGPTEVENRGFALAFWPDSRGKTPRALNGLIASQDPVVDTAESFATVSIAARGLYAMEFLLYDATISTAGNSEYHCALTQAVAADIAATAQDLAADWHTRYAELMRNPTEGGVYQSEAEVSQEFFKALNTGLQITADMRLGRPLGTYDAPRPKRAEAWRSDRSLRNVTLSLEALERLAMQLANTDPEIEARLGHSFATALTEAKGLDDPRFARVSDPSGRFRVEVLQRTVNDIRAVSTGYLGPLLGVSGGFNSLDGD